MSILQSKMDQVRYMKRQNLEEEAKMIGNYYRDIIRQYGVDCNYYKIKVPYLEQFKKTIDDNVLILHAYGQDSEPDYTISSDMITYMEVDSDLLQLNKYGIVPEMNATFYFDSTDFACSLAYKLGQLKEYKIVERDIHQEVPGCLTSDPEWRYALEGGLPVPFESDILSGKCQVVIGPYEVGKEYTVMAIPVEHGDVAYRFPSNDSIYKSFEHVVDTNDYVESMVMFTYKVDEITAFSGYVYDDDGEISCDEQTGQPLFEVDTRYVLNGKIHGAVLFRDLSRIGKYLDVIHPDVGDIVTIDFPDGQSRQQFEITECLDKNLASDGINPLLHKYVWKCKAKRYVNSGEKFPEKNESNERWKEGIDFLDDSDEEVGKQVGKYDDDHSDAVYGGYERPDDVYDKESVVKKNSKKEVFLDDGSYIELLQFRDRSRLLTDGWSLFFVSRSPDGGEQFVRLVMDDRKPDGQNPVPTGIQYLKSTDDALFFVNFDNMSCRICEDESITKGEIQLCLESLVDSTFGSDPNNGNGSMFYKFRTSNTVLFTYGGELYCRFGNGSGKIVKLT